jgi:hypothetical protein
MKYCTMSNSCCHYNYHEVMTRYPVDNAPQVASPSCLQSHPQNISMPKHSSPAKVIITNIPVNNTAGKMKKDAWKHTGGGSATDCVGCGENPSVQRLMVSV